MEARTVNLPKLISILANIINADGVETRLSTLRAHPMFKELLDGEEINVLVQSNASLTANLKKAQDALATANANAVVMEGRIDVFTADTKKIAAALHEREEALKAATESGKRRESELLAELKSAREKAEGFENELIGFRKAQEDPITQLLQSNVVASVVSQRDEVVQLRASNVELAQRIRILEAKIASYENQDAELAKKLENA